MSEANDKKAAVGYGRPPEATRFKPGQSGNPRGRPKGVRNFITDLREELSEKIRICESGKELRVSKQRAVIKSLVAAALKGDVRATSTLVSLCARAFVDEDKAAPSDELSETDAMILNSFVDRKLERRPKTPNLSTSQDIENGL